MTWCLAAWAGVLSLSSSAIASTLLVNCSGRRRLLRKRPAAALRAALLLCFGLLGATLASIEGLFVAADGDAAVFHRWAAAETP